ncbi:hypothetical protein BJD12_15625 [Xanthomonas vesicatoria ATCC 35937]|nr:hypothetical protein BJD12_15625 [Xanthomonas vesicatoria ATCC 35937]
MPASVPVDLLPASAHRLRWDVGDVLSRLVARAAVEQASDSSAHLLGRQPRLLPLTSRSRSASTTVGLQQCVAASITRHHPEVP